MNRTRILLTLVFLVVAIATAVFAAEHAVRVPAASECPAMKQEGPVKKQACPGMRGSADPTMTV